MSVFEGIKSGLEEAIAYEQGTLKAKKTKMSVTPVAAFTPEKIKQIRNKTGLTQVMFANYMGVSTKTVEAWESGRNQPDGAARRLLAITKKDPTFPMGSGIVAK